MDTEKPAAWACRTCNKIDWSDTIEQLAKPEHVSHRGVDIGICKGKMIPLFTAQADSAYRKAEEKYFGEFARKDGVIN